MGSSLILGLYRQIFGAGVVYIFTPRWAVVDFGSDIYLHPKVVLQAFAVWMCLKEVYRVIQAISPLCLMTSSQNCEA